MYTWSTAHVDPRDRFDYWREVRAKGLFGVTAELEPEGRPNFSGEFSLRKFGNAGLVELRASPYRVERRAADIADAPSDSLCIYQQLGGGGWFGDGKLEAFSLHDGAFATSYSDLPYRTAPLGRDGFNLRILKVPVSEIIQPPADFDRLIPRPVHDHAALGPLLQSCFQDIADISGEAAEAATPLVQAVAQIALMERGIARPGGRLAQRALRIGRLSLARRLIAQNLTKAELSPNLIAGLLGISVRHVHMLFEMTEMSFSQTVTALRIERSRRLLRLTPDRPIAEIANACGFESLATFYRVFNAALAMTPGDYRTQPT